MNVLISAAGRRVALLRIFREALAEIGISGRVFAADMSPMASAFHDADQGFLVPRCTTPAFVPAVLELCREHGIELIVPTIDTELPIYAAEVDRFRAAGVTVLISSPELISIANDKRRTHEWLVANDFPTVKQAEVDEVFRSPEAWMYPLLVKPVGGSSSIGVAIVSDEAALRHATKNGDYIVQTIAPGRELTVDVLVDREGRCVCAVPRERVEVRAGEVSKAVTRRRAAVIDLAKRLFEALPGAFGVQNVQVFADEDDVLSIIEINPRFGGGFPLTWEAGARYPCWLLEELTGRASGANERWTDGMVMLRYDDAVFVREQDVGR